MYILKEKKRKENTVLCFTRGKGVNIKMGQGLYTRKERNPAGKGKG